MSELREDIANALMATLRLFDPRTADHGLAVSTLAERLAVSMNLDDDTVEQCRLGALLHDIGLIRCDSFILQSVDQLSDLEAAIIGEHPGQSGELLARIPALADLSPIVRAHHERIDGSGYPDALAGEEIPLEARIISVADAFHAMTAVSTYRNTLSPMSAVAELVGNSGTQFDSRTVDTLCELLGATRRRHLRTA